MASIARYDPVADFYMAEVGDAIDDPATAALLGLIGDVAGSRLLDLACGQGRVTRELARRGAIWPEQADDFPLIDHQRDPVEGHDIGAASACSGSKRIYASDLLDFNGHRHCFML